MNFSYAPADVPISSNPSGAADTRLRGHWLILAQAAWLVVAVVALLLFIVTLSVKWAGLHDPANEVRAGLAQLGLSVGGFAVYSITLEVILGLSFFAVGALIFWRKSDEWLALFVSLTLITIGAIHDNETIAAMEAPWRLMAELLGDFGWTSIWILLYLFPDGRFVPRWTRLLAVVFVIVQALTVLSIVFPNLPFSEATLPSLPGNMLALFFLGSFLFAQIYRYWRVSGPVQRQQTKWFAFGVTIALSVAVLVNEVLGGLFPLLVQPGSLYALVAQTVLVLTLPLIPLSLGVAILRYRLWDIDVIINRTLVYGLLTVSVAGIYVLVVGYLGVVFQARGNLLISLLATGLVAVLFAPLRERLQRGVNRLMYGERDEPYAVLSRLGQRLEATLAPEAMLPTLVETVAQALKLPYVAIALTTADEMPFGYHRPPTADELTIQNPRPSDGQSKIQNPDDGFEIVASYGLPAGALFRLSLVYQSETVGRLLLAPRSPGETFSVAERRLLDDLARHAGIAAHAVCLTADLQQARVRLITTREEERRRLRRDLHDGLGPALASLALQADTARDLVRSDPAQTEALLADITAQAQAAIVDIRRLVYDLRPPALDDLGLVSALRAHLAHDHHHGVHVVIEAPAHLPLLPAAVEVAAYRIVQEALANVIHHAEAHTCIIHLAVDSALRLAIIDDGRGLSPDRRAGVGLTSMRERAVELGGMCVVETAPEGGTCVRAWLPLLQQRMTKE